MPALNFSKKLSLNQKNSKFSGSKKLSSTKIVNDCDVQKESVTEKSPESKKSKYGGARSTSTVLAAQTGSAAEILSQKDIPKLSGINENSKDIESFVNINLQISQHTPTQPAIQKEITNGQKKQISEIVNIEDTPSISKAEINAQMSLQIKNLMNLQKLKNNRPLQWTPNLFLNNNSDFF